MKYDVLVTRHQGLVPCLEEMGLIDKNTEIVSTATRERVEGRRVAGVLPYELASLCDVYKEIVVRVPTHLRSKKLSVEEVKEHLHLGDEYKVRSTKQKDRRTEMLANYILDYETEWEDFEEHCDSGLDPFEHIVFVAYEALYRESDLQMIQQTVEKYALEPYKIKFAEYVSRNKQ